MIEITRDGIAVDRLDEIVARLENGYKNIYGSNINLDPETPDGQLIGIFAQELADMGQGFLYLRQQTDPEFATGRWLEQLVAFSGLKRRQAARSYLRSVVITGTPFTNIDNTFKVKDKNNNLWEVVSKTQLNGDGSARADFKSVNPGAFNLDAGENLELETFVLGINHIVTMNQAEVGEQVESDEKLRERFRQAKAVTAQSSITAITTNIFKLAGVRKVLVLENFTGEIDENGIQPHTIEAIVDGGEDEAIAQTIYRYKDGGCGLQGNTQVNIFADNLNRKIVFDRPDFVDLHIKMTLQRYGLYTEVDKVTIKKNLVALDFGINESVYISRLISTINKSQGFSIKTIQIGRSKEELSSDDLVVDIREIARFLENNIEIEVL